MLKGDGRMQKKLVSEEQAVQILQLFDDGNPLIKIRATVGCTQHELKKVLNKNNIFTRNKYIKDISEVTEFDKDRIYKMYDNGIAVKNIVHTAKCPLDILKMILDEKINNNDCEIELQADVEEENKKPINCGKQGSRCIYKRNLSNAYTYCDYLCTVGHSRGCDAKECTKYQMRKRRKKAKQ
jgi:hypothetical protein